MSASWFQFQWDAELAPLQTAHCSLVGTEVGCADAVRCMEYLRFEVGLLPHFMAMSDIALGLIRKGLDAKLTLVTAFFRLGVETHAQFFSEEARRITDAFERIPVAGNARRLVMLEMEAADFDRMRAVVQPTVLRCQPFTS